MFWRAPSLLIYRFFASGSLKSELCLPPVSASAGRADPGRDGSMVWGSYTCVAVGEPDPISGLACSCKIFILLLDYYNYLIIIWQFIIWLLHWMRDAIKQWVVFLLCIGNTCGLLCKYMWLDYTSMVGSAGLGGAWGVDDLPKFLMARIEGLCLESYLPVTN